MMMDTAMIFAAGLGTRLAPLTQDRPKALVEVGGKTMLQRTVDKLVAAGIKKIVINSHHFHLKMIEAFKELHYPGVKFILTDESEALLDTGGGLLNAAEYLRGNKPFVLHNVDVISDIDLGEMYQRHVQQDALASLAVSKRASTRCFLWHKEQLCGWQNTQTGKVIQCYPTPEPPQELAFSGIHVVSPEIFDLMEETGAFSINQVYLRLASTRKIIAYIHDSLLWADLGTTSKIAKALEMMAQHPEKFPNL